MPFFPPATLDRLQEGEGEQYQGYVVVPAPIPGDLVVVEPELALGELEVLLDGPAEASDPGQRGQRDRLRRVGQEVLELLGVAAAQWSAHHQPGRRARPLVLLLDHAQPGELVLAWAL